MSVLDRYLGELQALRSQVAENSLTSPADKTAFAFGQAVGRLEGLRLAEETLNRVLNDTEQDSDAGRHRSKA